MDSAFRNQPSEYLRDRARDILAGGISSNIRLAESRPLFFRRASGAEVEDVDGRRYVDYICGHGPIVLGHGDRRVNDAIIQAIESGQLFGGEHPLEIQVAEQIREAVPSLELLRFSSTGSEAIHAAIRLARAATGRSLVVRFDGHYHGWLDTIHVAPLGQDDVLAPARPGTRGQMAGAIKDLLVLPWNDSDALALAADRLRGQVGAVILEPILCNAGVIPPRPGYLETIREWCNRENAILIFDEVVTGFRVALGGAQALFGIRPDLAVFGKAIANGFPISVVGGRREIMGLIGTGDVLHAGTFNANVIVLAAARATLQILAASSGAIYQSLNATGRRLMSGLQQVAAEKGLRILLQGPGAVFHMWFSDHFSISDPRVGRTVGVPQYALFLEAMHREGIRLGPGGRWYVNAAHTDDHIARTLAAAGNAFSKVAEAFPPIRPTNVKE